MTTLKIYHGADKPLTAVGVHQVRLLSFASSFVCWHHYSNKREDIRAINGLEKRGSIIVNRETKQYAINYSQFRG